MATLVIVHGGFGGGWEWTRVAGLLRQRGHDVFAPTLTGMGERAHLGPEIGLETHVQDVIAVLEFERLGGVVLCGASYAGMVITGVADRVPNRIARLIYIDALIPRDGQCVLDLLPADFAQLVEDVVDEHGHGWLPLPDFLLPPEGLIPDAERARYVDRLGPQPAATFTEPARLTGGGDGLPRCFVRCTAGELEDAGDPIAPMAARARAEGWEYRELPLPHDPHVFDPAGTAVVLHELATRRH